MKLIPVTIHLQEDTIDKINEAIAYKNHVNYLTPSKENPTDYDIEDFITASINARLNEIKNYMELVDYGELGIQGNLKNNFKKFLDKTELNQKDLSDITGIHRTNLSQIMSNKVQPSLETFIRIWLAFKCPPIHELLYKESE